MENPLTDYLGSGEVAVVEDAELAVALRQTANDATTGSADAAVDFLSFSGKTGLYSLGRDKGEVDPDQHYVVEPLSFVGGWVCWKDSEVADRIEWNALKAATQAVAEHDLEDHGPYREKAGEGWQQMLGFGAVTMDSVSTLIKFSSTSKSGRNAVGGLMHEISSRAAVGEPSMPIITFSQTSFEAMRMTNFKPVFVVQMWSTRASVQAYRDGDLSADDLIDGVAVKPKRKPRKKK